MRHPQGISPLETQPIDRADLYFQTDDGTHTAIWAPGTLADYGIAQTERVPDNFMSQELLHNNAIVAARLVHLSAIGGLLNTVGFHAWSEFEQGMERTLMHFPSAPYLEAHVRKQNRELPRDNQLIRIAPQPGRILPMEIFVDCLAEEEPALAVSTEPELLAHDISVHVTAWLAMSVSARVAGRDHARAVLRGDIPVDPLLFAKKVHTPVAQLGYRLDTYANALLINEKSMTEPLGFAATGLGAAIAQRGASELSMAYTRAFGVDHPTAKQLVQDTWAHTDRLRLFYGPGK